jgi:hypothetical protein
MTQHYLAVTPAIKAAFKKSITGFRNGSDMKDISGKELVLNAFLYGLIPEKTALTSRTISEDTSKSMASTLGTIAHLAQAFPIASRKLEAEALIHGAGRPFNDYAVILKDTVGGIGATSTDLFEGKGDKRKLKATVKPVKAAKANTAQIATVRAEKAARAESAVTEPAGKAEPSAAQSLTPKVRLVALMNDLQALSAELQFSDAAKGKALLEKIGTSFVSLEAITKP